MRRNEASFPYESTCTEWSMTRSDGRIGFICSALPPRATNASRMAARSTTEGTPVKSCRITRAGRKAISTSGTAAGSQLATAAMWSRETLLSSSWRSRFSSRMRSEKGKVSTSPTIPLRRASSRKISAVRPPGRAIDALARKLSRLIGADYNRRGDR